jgi:hypothetical protein
MDKEEWVGEKDHAMGGYGAAVPAEEVRAAAAAAAAAATAAAERKRKRQKQDEGGAGGEEGCGGEGGITEGEGGISDGEGGLSLGVCRGQTVAVTHFASSTDLNNNVVSRLVRIAGGNVCSSYRSPECTVVLVGCSDLPPAHLLEEAAARGLPVVRKEWLFDGIEDGELPDTNVSKYAFESDPCSASLTQCSPEF